MEFRIRVVIGAICCLVIIAVTAIAVSVVTALSSASVENVGKEHAKTLSLAAKIKVENFFLMPTTQTTYLQVRAKRAEYRLPIDEATNISDTVDTDWVKKWHDAIEFPLVEANFSYVQVFGLLVDGTVLRSRKLVKDGVDILSLYLYNPEKGRDEKQYYVANQSRVPDHLRVPYPLKDRPSHLFAALPFVTNLTKRQPSGFWLNVGVTANPVNVILADGTTLHNSTGHYLGLILCAQTVTGIGELLRSTVSVGAEAVMIDGQNALMGSSIADMPTLETLRGNATETRKLTSFCADSPPTLEERIRVCRLEVFEYPYEPVRKYARYSNVTQVFKKDRHFVVLTPISNTHSLNFAYSLALFYPIDFVLGGVRTSQIYGYILCGAIGFVASCLLVLWVSWILAPLSSIARRMKNSVASSGDKGSQDGDSAEDDEPQKSMLTEILEVQEAFEAMQHELCTLKQFVPHALMGHNDQQSGSDLNTERFSNPLAETEELADYGHDEHVPSETNTSAPLFIEVDEIEKSISRQKLGEARNKFSLVPTSILVLEISNLSDDPHGVGDQVEVITKAFISSVVTMGGVIEQLHPNRCVATFNAHFHCHMHEKKACEAGLSISRSLYKSGYSFDFGLAIDTKKCFVGTCGHAMHSARVVFGEPLDSAEHIIPLSQRLLDVSVCVTHRTLRSSAQSDRALPIDKIQVDWPQGNREKQIILYSIISSKNITAHSVEKYKGAFAALSEMRLPEATRALSMINDAPLTKHVERLGTICEHYLSGTGLGDSDSRKQKGHLRRKLISQWEPCGLSIRPMFPSDGGSPNKDEGKEKEDQGFDENDEMTAEQVRTRLQEEVDRQIAIVEAPSAEEATDDPSTQFISVYTFKESLPPSEVPSTITDVHGVTWQRSSESLGGGSFAQVYRALGPAGSLSAIKVFSLNLDTDVASLAEEQELMRSIKHNNVVSYYSCAILPQHFVIVMEYVPGGSIQQLISSFGALPYSMVQRYMREVIAGVEFLHQSGIVHCDIKPGNILVTVDGECRLTDFGCSLTGQISCESYANLRGTAAYLAPEVARGHSPSTASDVWALGIITLEMIYGKNPWLRTLKSSNGKGPSSLSFAKGMGEALFLEKLGKDESMVPQIPEDCPGDAAEFVRKCLCRDPADRADIIGLKGSSFLL